MKTYDHAASAVVMVGEKYEPKMFYRHHTHYAEGVRRVSTASKRVCPPRLTPMYGTARSYERYKYSFSKTVYDNGRTPWEPYSPSEYGETYSLPYYSPSYWAQKAAIIGEEDLKNEVRVRVLNRINNSATQTPVDILELGKTKSMVANAARDLVFGLRSLRSGRSFKKFVRTMNKDGFTSTLGKKWLEFLYGWTPFIGSAYDHAEVLAKRFQEGSVETGKVKVFREARMPSKEISGGTLTCRATAHGYYEYTVKDAKLLLLSQMGFTNPLAIAWELLPWSFVFDWFVDVGGYINRMDTTLGIGDRYWQYGIRRVCIASYPIRPPGGYFIRQEGTAELVTIYNDRQSPVSVSGNHFLGFSTDKLDTQKLVTALALINQHRSVIRSFS